MKMKTKEVIGFRLPEPDQMEKFEKLVDELKVKPSDLARHAFLIGLAPAATEIRERKLKDTQSLLEHLQGLTLSVSRHFAAKKCQQFT